MLTFLEPFINSELVMKSDPVAKLLLTVCDAAAQSSNPDKRKSALKWRARIARTARSRRAGSASPRRNASFA